MFYKGASIMTPQEIAADFTALCKAGAFEEAGRKYWAPGVRSLEPMEGPAAVADGLEAVLAKGEWWYSAHEVHSVTTEGPYVHGNQFALRFTMDVTVRATGQRDTGEEIGLYTVADGKIVEERFFFG
jgi:hypothetical protein